VDRLQAQLARWVEQDGCAWVKMKVGAAPEEDLARVRAARTAIGGAGLYVDANGAYTLKQALQLAHEFAGVGVCWFEEPVSSDDLEGLRLIRDQAPPGMEVAAGEYGYEPFYFRRMLEAGAVDVLQADATRGGGYTGFLKVAALADAWGLPLSAHTAPALHLPVCCAAQRVRHVEWFHDHTRIERCAADQRGCRQDRRPVPRVRCADRLARRRATVVGDSQLLRPVPAGLIGVHDGDLVLGQRLREPVEELLHRRRVGLGHDEREGIVGADLGGSEDVGKCETPVASARRTLPARPPDMTDTPFLVDPGLVLEPERDALTLTRACSCNLPQLSGAPF
jgi:hypothetical protein